MIQFKYNKHIVKKQLGQNFLIDTHIINNIINSISPKKTDIMIEIGPGLGALTLGFSNLLHKLFVIERDKDLVTRLHVSLCGIKNLKIFSKDVLTFDFSCIENNFYNSIRIFGNLPYNISVTLLFYLFRYDNIFDMHFMFQKEVANRLLALPGTKDYGKLSIISQYFCKITRLFDVSPRSFRPVPKVCSTFLKLVPYKKKRYYIKNMTNFKKVITLAFSKRRKVIRNSLSELFSEDILKNLSIDPMLRAENISIMQYCVLSNYIS
ncbi:MAG: 16S rRNA (adenine(1518)-N(6)/adenine(1519)-N(6))-dimethyltransferase RsmA [Buchnera aphidicola (Meitanaphis flavogallis)]